MKTSMTKEERKELYVNPDEFWELMRTYYEDTSGKWPEKLGVMIEKIANKMRWMPNFKDYYYVDEMISDAKVKMLQVLLNKKFNLYSYTPLSQDNYRIINDRFYIREYRRGSDQRKKVEGGKNERGMIIFLPDGDFRPINTSSNASEETIVVKNGREIKDQNGNVIHILREDDMRKYGAEDWKGLCLRTRNVAFGYFSQTCKHCYVARIKKEQANEELKQDIMEKTWSEIGGCDGWGLVRMPSENTTSDYEHFNEECGSDSDW